MRILLVALLLLAFPLAGCADKDDGNDDPAATSSGSSTRSGSASKSGTGAPGNVSANHPPTATMQANATQDDPLNVTFVLNGTDQDGDALTWTLDFGDNATENGTFAAGNASALPRAANVTHLYAAGGLYNVTLVVSDGSLSTNVTLQLNVTAGAPFEQFVASGTPDLACPQCSAAGANTGAGYRAGVNELDSYFVEIPAGAAGQPFTLTSTGGDPDMVFRTSCASSGTAVGSAFQADGAEAGVVPEGAVCALTWEPLDAMSTITLTIG